MPNRDDLIYAAGLFDGEGSISITRQIRKGCVSPIHTLAVRLSNTDRPTLDWMHETFTGNVSPNGNKPDENHKPAWCWSLDCQKAMRFLESVEPFLRIKRNQAQIGITFQQYVMGREKGFPLHPEEVATRDWARNELMRVRGNSNEFPLPGILTFAIPGVVGYAA